MMAAESVSSDAGERDNGCVELDLDMVASKLSIHDPIVFLRKENLGDVRMPARMDHDVKLPEPRFSVVDDYYIRDAPDLGSDYLRLAAKEVLELGDRIEYDCDEEDVIWLRLTNEKRRTEHLPPVSLEDVEYLVDRLEKESFLLECLRATPDKQSSDDEVVCCICNDGECQNANAILFCDNCNIPVHQGCYGVPYIPEGSWLCQRCLQSSPSSSRCCLCPNTTGAFKQTSDGRWAHVICALWVPEVSFGNAVFLEPVEDIEAIPPARWKLVCVVCRQKGVGACIQCHKPSCCIAFHVTCAQQANLYMKMETVKEASPSGRGGVKKVVMCSAHGPATNGTGPRPSWTKSPPKFNPELPENLVEDVASGVVIGKKRAFMKQLVAYWILKRQARSWAPLNRRLLTLPMDPALVSPGGRRCDRGVRENGADDGDDEKEDDEDSAMELSDVEVRKVREKKAVNTAPSTSSFPTKTAEVKRTSKREPSPVVSTVNGASGTNKSHRPTPNSRLSEAVGRRLPSIDRLASAKETDSKTSAVVKVVQPSADSAKETRNSGLLLRTLPSTTESLPARTPVLETRVPSAGTALTKKWLLSAALEAKAKKLRLEPRKSTPNVSERSKRKIKPRKVWEPDSSPPPRPAQKSTSASSVNHKSVTSNPNKSSGAVASANLTVNGNGNGLPPTVMNLVPRPPKFVPSPLMSIEAAPKSFLQYRSSGLTEAGSDDEDVDAAFPAAAPVVNPKKPNPAEPTKRVDAGGPGLSDSETSSSSSSSSSSDDSCSSSSSSSSSSCSSSSSSWTSDSESGVASHRTDGRKKKMRMTRKRGQGHDQWPKFEPLDLVWAKCRGYPWYPALVIDPAIPKTGFSHNGVPIPIPPEHVLSMQHRFPEKRYLILFFDNRRTWQWLPREKLDPLGVDSSFDRGKLFESKKPADRKAVKKAYERAVIHYARVSRGKDIELTGGIGLDSL